MQTAIVASYVLIIGAPPCAYRPPPPGKSSCGYHQSKGYLRLLRDPQITTSFYLKLGKKAIPRLAIAMACQIWKILFLN